MLVLERSELHELCAQVSSGDAGAAGTRLYITLSSGDAHGRHMVRDTHFLKN